MIINSTSQFESVNNLLILLEKIKLKTSIKTHVTFLEENRYDWQLCDKCGDFGSECGFSHWDDDNAVNYYDDEESFY